MNNETRLKNLKQMFSELTEHDQKSVYSIVWSFHAKDLLLRIEETKNKEGIKK